MKPVIRTDKNITSNLVGEKMEMEFDAESLAHLQSLYINVYKDRSGSVLREIACNAFDSHREAGNPDPIEITLPTRFNPALKITDHGVGLSVAEMRNIWRKYGASTKRDSNDQIGSFGIGCKSPLTYTDQFTVQIVKDGIEALISVAFNGKGVGELTVAYEGETDKPNGVEVTIPTPWPNDFAQKAKDLFQWWSKGSVLVDGVAPTRFDQITHVPNGYPREITPGVYMQEIPVGYYDGNVPSIVVMGNVAYPVALKDMGLDFSANYTKYNQRVIAFVDIGTLEPVPAREGFTDTVENQEALKAIGIKVATHAKSKAQSDINKAASMFDALAAITSVQKGMPSCFWPKPWTWRATEIPTRVYCPDVITITEESSHKNKYTPKAKGGFVVVHRYGSGKAHHREKSLSWDELQSCWYFKGFDLETFTASHRRRLNQWVENQGNANGVVPMFFVLTNTAPDSPLVRKDRIFDWEDVRQTKLPPTTMYRGKLVGSYDLIKGFGAYPLVGEIQAKDIDATKPIYFYCDVETKNDRSYGIKSRAQHASPYCEALDEPGATFVAFPPNRRAKFERMFPEAREVREVLIERSTKFMKDLSQDKKKALAVRQIERWNRCLALQDATISDPEVVAMLRLATLDINDEYKKFIAFSKFHNDIRTHLPEVPNPMDKYPLVDNIRYMNDGVAKLHAAIYVNAVYDASNSNSKGN
jgi:hypothetical protein